MTALLDSELGQTGEAPSISPAESPAPRRRGRPPRGASPALTADHIRAHAMKRYDLRDGDRQTAAHLRRILAQRHIPDVATVVIDKASLTFEWDE